MPEVDFEVDLQKRKHLVEIEEDVFDKLIEVAKAKNVSSETLINNWLKKKLLEAS